MTGLPQEFDCTLATWEDMYGLSRRVADAVKTADFDPEVVVALARGGWFAGRCLCDFLGLDDLASLKIEHYVGTAQTAEEPRVRYPLAEGSVTGKRVLLVDDIADSGASISRAVGYVEDRDPAALETATLQLLSTSAFEPTYVGARLEEWVWVVYPWNFMEDMVELVGGVIESAGAGPYTQQELVGMLSESHGLGAAELEAAQPGRMPEVLEEMDRRGLVTHTGAGWAPAD